MCFVAQHDPSGQAWFLKNINDCNSLAVEISQSPKMPSVKLLRPKPEGLPVFFVTSQSSSWEKKSYPFCFSRPPALPLFQLRRVPGCAHRCDSPALLAELKLERKEWANRSFTNISPSLFESTVRLLCRCLSGRACVWAWGSIVVKGRLMVSEANGWEAGKPERRTTEKGRKTHGCMRRRRRSSR